MKLFNPIFLFFTFISIHNAFGMFDTLDFDEVRQRGGFKSKNLQNVISIIPSEKTLSAEEIEDLEKSDSLTNLRTLNLKNQKLVDDKFIASLCSNSTFSRIINLNLSGTSITKDAFTYILSSKLLGSIRDLPQISGRFGVYSSMVYVTAEDINLEKSSIDKFNVGEERQKKFPIRYFHPQYGTQVTSPKEGIKMLEIKSY